MGHGVSILSKKQATPDGSKKEASVDSKPLPLDEIISNSGTPPSQSPPVVPSSPEDPVDGSARSRKTKIVCGWAGIGKSFLAQGTNFRAVDLDSAAFSWLKDAEGNNLPTRNPNAKTEYPAAIIKEFRSQKYDFLLVSTHDYVRKALQEEGIPYTIVYPSVDRKDEFLQRYTDRKNDEGMIKFLIGGWDELLRALKADEHALATHLEMTESGSFLEAYAEQLR